MTEPRTKASWRILWSLLLLLGIATVGLGAYSQMAPAATVERVFSEHGPVEQFGPWLWLSLGALIIALGRRLDTVSISALVVCCACAAREWDMHKQFTDRSMLNPGMYLSSEYPLGQQLIGGAILVVLAGSAGVLIWQAWRVWPRGRQPVPPWIWALGVAGLMLVGTKVLDRSPAILEEDFDIVLAPAVSGLFRAWEEGLETAIPLAFAAMVLAYRVRSGDREQTGDEAL